MFNHAWVTTTASLLSPCKAAVGHKVCSYRLRPLGCIMRLLQPVFRIWGAVAASAAVARCIPLPSRSRATRQPRSMPCAQVATHVCPDARTRARAHLQLHPHGQARLLGQPELRLKVPLLRLLVAEMQPVVVYSKE